MVNGFLERNNKLIQCLFLPLMSLCTSQKDCEKRTYRTICFEERNVMDIIKYEINIPFFESTFIQQLHTNEVATTIDN